MKVEVSARAARATSAPTRSSSASTPDEKKLREPAGARSTARRGAQLERVLDAEKFPGKAGRSPTCTPTAAAVPRVVVVGLGPRAETRPPRSCAGPPRRGCAGRATSAPARSPSRCSATGCPRASARRRSSRAPSSAPTPSTATSARRADKTVETLRVVEPDGRRAREAADGVRRGEIFAQATWFARDLINAPANDVHPTHLAQVATEHGQGGRAHACKVLERAECRKIGMGAFLGVAAGSEQPPKFIHLRTRRPARSRKRVAVIGKGITFDSGGLDLKPPEGMLRMKDDMSGAAAVLGIMRALPALKPAVEVHGLIAATENMPSGAAIRPGDILRAMNGTTIEIGNTDAEGRLTLADAHLLRRPRRSRPTRSSTWPRSPAPAWSRWARSARASSPTTRALADRLLAAADAPASGCGSCRSSTSTARTSRATWPTSTTSARAAAAPSPPACSSRSSRASRRGRTSTSPARPSSRRTRRWRPRAPPAARCARS